MWAGQANMWLTNPSIHLDAVLAKRKVSHGSLVRHKVTLD